MVIDQGSVPVGTVGGLIGVSCPFAPIVYCEIELPLALVFELTTYTNRPDGSTTTSFGQAPAGTVGVLSGVSDPAGGVPRASMEYCETLPVAPGKLLFATYA